LNARIASGDGMTGIEPATFTTAPGAGALSTPAPSVRSRSDAHFARGSEPGEVRSGAVQRAAALSSHASSTDSPKVLCRDDILDNITFTWLTNTAVSGARLYWESWGKLGYFNSKGVSIPVAVSVFPDELYPAPRSWTGRSFPNLIFYNKLEKGGHFAAWEQPALLAADLRAAFRSLRAVPPR
jgi:hypothetical protein